MNSAPAKLAKQGPDLSESRLRRRQRAEKRFRFYGIASILLAVGIVALLFVAVALKGYTGFLQTRIAVDIDFDSTLAAKLENAPSDSAKAREMTILVRKALENNFAQPFDRAQRKELAEMLSASAGDEALQAWRDDPSPMGKKAALSLLASDTIDMLAKGTIDRNLPEQSRSVSDQQIAWFDRLKQEGRIKTSLNRGFFISGDSREPELAGIGGALMGTLMTIFVAFVLALPVGIATSIYLEEFAPKNRFTDFIELNINNLASVPSIIFGILGLAVFLGFFGLPRSAPLAGGMVLSLMTLPALVISTRSSLRAVPPSIRQGAFAVGASKQQVVFHHVLPLSMPGIVTGAVIGISRAMGESAALLMIGMVAFIAQVPLSLTDPATVLPVQIYLWADNPERGFVEKTNAGILVMLALLLAVNCIALILRRIFDRGERL